MNVSVVSLSLGLSVALVSPALGQFGYALVGQFNLPAGTAAWDVGADGRAWALAGSTVYAQSSPGGGAFSAVGSVAPGTVADWGGTFIRVNDAGSMVAIGDNNFGASARVHFVSPAALASAGPGGASTLSVLSGNFDGNWNGNQFYVTGAASDFVPFVNRISFADATGSPVATRIITSVGGASGGVAFSGGRIFVGAGLGGRGTATGEVRSFDLLGVNDAGPPVAFNTGAAILGGPALSAWPLAFDDAGRLLVGGGDAFGGTSDIGYVAVIDLATGVRQLLSPAGTDTTYGVDFNAALNQIYVSEGGVVYAYAVPVPGSAAALTLSGLLIARRRRRG
ncbi:MAG TPA: hypothetical protein VEB22_02010 [Phycisphaerales bacterium]|nr:hypothetical protein [Phycisphaerales bacterium]